MNSLLGPIVFKTVGRVVVSYEHRNEQCENRIFRPLANYETICDTVG
jgi:hypothetical protein